MRSQRSRFWAIALWVLPALAAGFGVNAGRTADIDEGGKIYKQTLPSTVWVVTPTGGGSASTGTGSLIDVQHKLVLTNYHVVTDHDEVFVFFPIIQKNGKIIAERKTYIKEGARIRGKVKCRSSKKDLALIELQTVPPGAKAIRLAADSPTPGTRLHSIGNPGVSEALWAYTQGTVRQVYAKKFIVGGKDGEKSFQIDATIVETQSPVNPGDSGGPVVNSQGELVAVTEGHLDEQKARSYSIFIDVSEVKQFLKDNKIKLSHVPALVTPAKSTEDKIAEKPAPKPEDNADKTEKEAASLLRVAKRLAGDGLTDKARARYREVVEHYPNTKAAQEARELLKK